MKARLGILVAALSLAACVTVSKTVLDRSVMGNPVPRDQVRVYLPGDTLPEHTRIALLYAEGDADMTDRGQMIDKLREEAGKLGANAIVLGEIEDPGLGEKVAAAFLDTTANRTTQAIAIYVPSGGGR